MNAEDPLKAHRGRLLGLAYRMLGSRADAEDVVQDVYLRFAGADSDTIKNKEAWLVTTATRLCLDRLKSTRAQREIYVGPWLPEPVLDTEELSAHSAMELADDLSFALMLTLERLSAPERAAFLLHDVFEASYADIANALGKSEAACRQLVARARRAVAEGRPREQASAEDHEALLEAFVAATASGDHTKLQALLTEDVVATADGGGVKRAALNPIIGVERVARFFSGLAAKLASRGLAPSFKPARINGRPGLLLYLGDELDQTLSIETKGGRISAVYAVRNPEKLGQFAASSSLH